jgi:hypothetical protein
MVAPTPCGEFGHTGCKIGEMLPQLVERKAEREDLFRRMDGQVSRQTLAAQRGISAA